MDREAFALFLRRRGKKPHVVEGLIRQVELFADFLVCERGKTLEAAGRHDLQEYLAKLLSHDGERASKKIRGLALYFSFVGDQSLASQAAEMRATHLAQSRKSFPLRDFRGVDPLDIRKLEAIGIVNANQMLQAGLTPAAREALAAQTGVSPAAIRELVKLSDLSRLEGLKSVRARLYYAAGADTPEKIAQWEPEDLRRMLGEFVNRTGFDGLPPLPKEVQGTVQKARQLPRLVQYEPGSLEHHE